MVEAADQVGHREREGEGVFAANPVQANLSIALASVDGSALCQSLSCLGAAFGLVGANGTAWHLLPSRAIELVSFSLRDFRAVKRTGFLQIPSANY